MLNLILGKSSCSKTEYIRDLIAKRVKDNEEKCIIIVPEQFSYETEKAMLEMVGASGMLKVDVLSLSRLAEVILEESSSNSQKPAVDDGVKMMTMSLALESLGDNLRIYKKYTARPQLISELVSFATELKQWTVSVEELEEFSNNAEKSSLKSKLDELCMILSMYNTLLEKSYFNTDNSLDLLSDVLEEYKYFENVTVAIDGFTRFTKQEAAIVEKIIKQSENVYITFDADMSNDEYSLFANNNKQVNVLKNLANKSSVKIAPITYIDNAGNGIDEKLLNLTNNIFNPDYETFNDSETDTIEVVSAPNKADECEYVAMSVKKLLREEGARCRDIIVFQRTKDSYDSMLASAFKKYGVPFFDDDRQPIDSQPLVVYLRSLLEIACNGLSTDVLMRHLKTGLTDLTDDEISDLENYAFLWKISATQWKNEFTENPNGYGKEISDFDIKELERLNEIRRKAVAPVLSFKRDFTETNEKEKSEIIFDYLVKNSIDIKLKKLANELFEEGKTALSYEQNAVWTLVVQMLDKLYLTTKNSTISNKRYYELFDILLSVSDFGTVPQGLDVVTLSAADRARTSNKKYVFIVGANDGVFPLNPPTQGLLSDKDRTILKNAGIELAQTAEYKLTEEKFIAYRAVSTANKKLFVSFCDADYQGVSMSASSIVREIKKIYPNLNVKEYEETDLLDRIESSASAFEVYAKNFGEQSEFMSSLNAFLKSDSVYEGRIRTLNNLANKTKAAIDDKELATKLFGKNMYLSASKTEVYYKCPFEYFCKFGIKAQPRKEATVDPALSGSIIHETFEKILGKFSKEELILMDQDVLKENIEKIMSDYLEEKMGGSQTKTKRFMKQYEAIGDQILFVLLRIIEELKVCDFIPTDFELPIKEGAEVLPYELQLSDGGSLAVSGSVDRVDIMEKNGKKYLRIVDYKSNGKSFKLSDVISGLSTQMLIYLFAIDKNGKEKYGDIIPSGVLYMPAKQGKPDLDRNASQAEIDKKLLKTNKMDGIVVEDMDIIEGMEHDVAGNFIPVSVKKDGSFYKSSKLIKAEDFVKLKRKIDSILKEMALNLHKGIIPAFPVDEDTCKYCDYSSVCGFENGDEYREILKAENDEVIEMLNGEEEENE